MGLDGADSGQFIGKVFFYRIGFGCHKYYTTILVNKNTRTYYNVPTNVKFNSTFIP